MRIPWRPSVVSCLALAAAAGVTAACSGSRNAARYGPASPRLVDPKQPIPKGGGGYKLGAPYQIDGRWYVPQEEPGYDRTGLASFYAEDFHGRRTSNGEIFDMWALTAAHPPCLCRRSPTSPIWRMDAPCWCGSMIADLTSTTAWSTYRAQARAISASRGLG